MSTNYYIRTTDANMVFDLMPRVSIMEESRYFEIHIAQTCGSKLKPLFEKHSYSSFEELKNILCSNIDKCKVFDEYNCEIKHNEFIEEMEKLNKIGKTRIQTSLNEHGIFKDKDGYEFLDCDFC